MASRWSMPPSRFKGEPCRSRGSTLNILGRQPFLLRARRKVIVQTKVRGRQRRLSLGRLPHRMGRPIRYRHVLYHSQKAEPVDVIVYRGKGFQEPWFLIVPPDSETG